MTRILDMAPPLAERFYQQGVDHEEVGALDKAMLAFRRAVQTDGSNVEARLALAYHCHRLDRLDEAVAHCRAVLATKPCAAAYFALGHLLISRQEYSAALESLGHCLDLDPTYDQARYQIAFVYYLRGEYEVAITAFHRAAARDPDWETLFFLGECYRMTRRPTEASHIFRKALAAASNWGQIELTRGQQRACQRLAEFPPEQSLTVKERVYCECGGVYLGSALDDGLAIPPYLFYHFSYADVARTLHRLAALRAAQGWQWSAVLPVDIVSLPLALALAHLWGVGTEPVAGGQTLVVQALGEMVEGLQDTAERVPDARTFCLLACWSEEWHPDIVGLATPLVGSLPWYRASTSHTLPSSALAESPALPKKPWMDPRPPEAIAADILASLATTPPDLTLPAQVEYYHRHPLLRWQ